MTSAAPSPETIADYALISDCHSAALVSRTGSIDWACLRRFDAGSVFGRILDSEKGGFFSLRPQNVKGTHRRYVTDTNVVETTFTTERGEARVYDCFTMREGGRRHPHHQLLRIVEGISGEVTFEAIVEPRFDYGELAPWIRPSPDGRSFSAVGGNDAFVLHAEPGLALDRAQVRLTGSFTVGVGQRCRFSLTSFPAHEMKVEPIPAHQLDARLADTIKWWKEWVAHGDYSLGGEHRSAVIRSSLVLKALTCAPTGAIIAAPTTSLPELPGGTRNWDYRFSWIRDSTLTMAALLSVGHAEVAEGFKRFIERTTAGRANDLQIMYGCYGERRLPELELAHLSGYQGSRPVRIGNAAAHQQQLDVFGELLEAAQLWSSAGTEPSADEWRFLRGLVDAACEQWREPDRGLWEMRGAPRHFVHSKVMCWVALDRGIRAAQRAGQTDRVARWESERDEIRATVERDGVDPVRGCFVQAFGSRELDASLLLLPIVGFVHANDQRMERTVEAIQEELCTEDLVLRYRPARAGDGLEGREGAFLMASFWLVEVLAMQGKLDEAGRRFERLLALGNDLGLYSEEYSPEHGLLGNFPQAFTHMALINAAAQLSEAKTLGLSGRSSTAERWARRRERVRSTRRRRPSATRDP